MKIIPEFGVANVRESLAFFERAFGAKIIETVGSSGDELIWAQVKIGNVDLMFQELGVLSDEFPCKDSNRENNWRACVVVKFESANEFENVCRRIEDEEVEVVKPRNETDYGTIELTVSDPDTNILVLSLEV